MAVSLRAAAAADCVQVYAWNFAPDVRAVSGRRTIVSLAEHSAWYTRRITDGGIWIVLVSGAPVGVVRIDGSGPGMISIALDATARGRGVGKRAIAAACDAWARPVVAQIRNDNLPSRAAFEACGFTAVATMSTDELVTYTWRP
jgi:L-amino acid N-acyltransferase YncA